MREISRSELETPERPSYRVLDEEKPKKHITKFSSHRVEFSDGSVLVSNEGEFLQEIIEAILEAGD